jgi:hypothetical protein
VLIHLAVVDIQTEVVIPIAGILVEQILIVTALPDMRTVRQGKVALEGIQMLQIRADSMR